MTSPTTQEQAIGQIIAARMAALGMSQVQVAADTGVISQPLLSQVLTGQRSLSLGQFAAICALLDLDPAQVWVEAETLAGGEDAGRVP